MRGLATALFALDFSGRNVANRWAERLGAPFLSTTTTKTIIKTTAKTV